METEFISRKLAWFVFGVCTALIGYLTYWVIDAYKSGDYHIVTILVCVLMVIECWKRMIGLLVELLNTR